MDQDNNEIGRWDSNHSNYSIREQYIADGEYIVGIHGSTSSNESFIGNLGFITVVYK